MKLEEMSQFFAERIDGYDEHMLKNVSGCKVGYQILAKHIPDATNTILDLGCGTGLQLAPIFRKLPTVHVTGIDLSESMLNQLRAKYPDRQLNLIHGSYFDVPFESQFYDAAISFQTLHHFEKEEKLKLYKKLYKGLKDNAIYLECDYMVNDQKTEDFHFEVLRSYRKEHQIPEDVFLHYDTPCTVENQRDLLIAAGFSHVEVLWGEANTTLLMAKKAPVV